jgi:hypothetical protein
LRGGFIIYVNVSASKNYFHHGKFNVHADHYQRPSMLMPDMLMDSQKNNRFEIFLP